ncbi:MAG TPA: hypothetical protein DIT67_08325 [Octadecabacter sp.]|nr:hypothetical protein [Octadecabacter sp.]
MVVSFPVSLALDGGINLVVFLAKTLGQPVDGSGFLPDTPAPVWGFRVRDIERAEGSRNPCPAYVLA